MPKRHGVHHLVRGQVFVTVCGFLGHILQYLLLPELASEIQAEKVSFLTVSIFCSILHYFWRQFRIFKFRPFTGRECFEFLAARPRIGANVSNFVSGNGRRLERYAHRMRNSRNVSNLSQDLAPDNGCLPIRKTQVEEMKTNLQTNANINMNMFLNEAL